MLGGFLEGFNKRTAEHRQENERAAQAERDRSSKVLSTLAGSDDPEVRNMAVTAMLSGAAEGKAGKGLAGFFGQVRQHPLFQALTSLVNTPQAVDHQVNLPPGSGEMPGQTLPFPGRSGSAPAGSVSGAAGSTGGYDDGSDQSNHDSFGGPGAPAIGAPPPAALGPAATGRVGVPTPNPSYRTYQPRQLFLTEEQKAEQTASGTMRGRLGGAFGTYETLVGHKPDQAFVEQTTRGALGAPQRLQQDKVGTLELANGTMVAGHYDGETDKFIDDTGQVRTDVKAFIPGNPHAGAGNPAAGAFTVHTPDPNSPTGWSAVRKTPDGREIDRSPSAAPVPPTTYPSILQTPGGAYGVTRGGAVSQLVGAPVGTDPQVYASQLKSVIDLASQRARERTMKLGPLGYDEQELKKNLDEEAKAAGFVDWAAMIQKHAEAVARVGGTVPPGAGGAGGPAVGAPPPAALPPKSAGRGNTPPAAKKKTTTNDPDGLRKFLTPRGPGG